MQAFQTVKPATEPLTVTEAKLHLRVEHNHEDTLIGALIVAAREQAEFLTGQRLMTQTWMISASKPQTLPLYGLTPIQNITSDGAMFAVDGFLPPSLTIDGPATITIICGFGDASDVPASIIQWMLLRIGAMYEQREYLSSTGVVSPAPHSFADALLDPYTLPRT